MIAAPPSDAGAANPTDALASPGVTSSPVGGPATVRGVKGAEAADSAPSPTALTARSFTT